MIAWSYSRLSTAERCLKMFRHHNILKDVISKEGPAMIRGHDVHGRLKIAVDRYADNKVLSDDPKIIHVMPLIKSFCDMHDSVTAEIQISFRKDLALCDWYNKATWLRAILDVIGIRGSTASVIDWKTGQVRYEKDQLRLSAMVTLIRAPSIEEVHTSLVFVDHKQSTPVDIIYRSELPNLIHEFSDRAEILQIAERKGQWPATPGNYCKWQCDCTKQQCQYAK